MKKNYDILHDLVQSLTKAEKRSISLNSQSEGKEKIYLKIFKCLEKQKEYNELELLSFFSGTDKKNQLGFAKNYLQNLILKNLRIFHSDLKANISCKNLIIEAEILYWKCQFKLAEKLLIRAQKIAQKHQFFLLLEEISYWQTRIVNATSKLEQFNPKLIHQNSKENIDKYLNILAYKELSKEIQLLISKSELVRDKNEENIYENYLQHPLLKDISQAKSNEAIYTFYVIKSVLFRLLKKHQESKNYRIQLITFLEQNPYIIEENPILLITSIHNILMFSFVAQDEQLFNEYINKLKSYQFKMPREQANMFSTLSLFELGNYIEHKNYDKAVDFYENQIKLDEYLLKLVDIENEYLLHYNASLAYFYKKDFKKALKALNLFINNSSKKLRVDIRASAFILNVIIHYELNNTDTLPYLIKSTLSYLKTNKLYRNPDATFVNMFNTIPNEINHKAFHDFLIQKKKELIAAKTSSIIASDLSYIEWIDGKLKN